MKKFLLYTEVPLSAAEVQQRLSTLDRSAAVRIIVPIRPLTMDEQAFLEAEHVSSDDMFDREAKFARWRLRKAAESILEIGFTDVHGDAVAGSPVKAIEKAVESDTFDAVVVATEPPGMAGWVHMDLAHQVARHVDEPVIHVELEPVH